MKILKNVKIIHSDAAKPESSDVHIKDGKIVAIAKSISATDQAEVIDLQGAWLMPGWFDLGVYACDPGHEHREDVHSAMQAARAGGFTDIAVMPETLPTLDTQSQIRYILDKTRNQEVRVHPIGALTVGLEGKDMAELMDMHAAGAVAFSDSATGSQDAGLLKRTLEYTLPFRGVVFNRPHHKSIAAGGQMHEGIVSTSLGLKALPALAETLTLQRDLSILAYTGGRLHVHLISCAESVALIRTAKAQGLAVTCSVSIAHLCLTDQLLRTFDSNLKVLPPLRTENDRLALIDGLKDGTIDCICTDHTPWHVEAKDLEFPYAEFGMTGLETAFSMCRMYLADVFSPQQLAAFWSDGPRKVLGLQAIRVEVGTPISSLSCFLPDHAWHYNQQSALSKSRNHFLFDGPELIGKAWLLT